MKNDQPGNPAPAPPSRVISRDGVRVDEAPVHEEPWQTAQPAQEIVEQLRRARLDIGALIGRTDELEAMVRRIDRQTIMMVGTFAMVIWVVRRALAKVEELGGADA